MLGLKPMAFGACQVSAPPQNYIPTTSLVLKKKTTKTSKEAAFGDSFLGPKKSEAI